MLRYVNSNYPKDVLMFSNLKRDIKNATINRMKFGFNPNETWSLDSTICSFILPRLKYFNQTKKAIPIEYTEEQWDEILQKMIDCFQIMEDGYKDFGLIDENDDEKVKEGLKLFSENFTKLWW